jgi:RHS repeat-associated protein
MRLRPRARFPVLSPAGGRSLCFVLLVLVLMTAGPGGVTRPELARADLWSSYSNAVLGDQPIGYWHLGEASGQFADSTPGGHPGQKSTFGHSDGSLFSRAQPSILGGDGGISDGAVPSGFGLDPNGGDVRIDTGIDSRYDFRGQRPFSLEIWVNPGANGSSFNGGLFGDYSMDICDCFDVGYGLYVSWPSLEINFVRASDVNGAAFDRLTGPSLPSGTWTQVVATYDGATMRLYLDGVLAGQLASSRALDTLAPLLVGATLMDYGVSDYPGYFYGSMDEASIYDKALTAAQIGEHYQAGLPLATAQTWGTRDGRGVHALAPTATRSDDVDTLTGAFTTRADDLAAAGLGVRFDFGRTYTSADTAVGRLGPGWTDSVSASLGVQPNGDVLLHGEDGQRVYYTLQPDGSFKGAPGAESVLSAVPGGYRLVRHDQVVYAFDGAGVLQSMLDRNGQGLGFTYTAGRLTGVTDAAGQTATFAYNGDGLLGSVTSADGRSVSYGYTNGDLTSVTLPDPDGDGPLPAPVWTYAYTDGLLTGVIDPNNHTVVSNVYDPGSGRVTQQTDANGKLTSFAWDAASGTSTLTDANGRAWKDVYDSSNALSAEIDPAGDTTRLGYDDGLNTSGVTAPGGSDTTTLAYQNHNLMSATAPASLGGAQKTFTYTGRNDPDTVTDARGTQSVYGYDAAGNNNSITLDGQQVFAATYTGQGEMLTSTDGNNNATGYTYDPAGNVASVTAPDPDGAGPLEAPKTTYTFNAFGEVLTKVDPRGNCSTCNADEHTTSYTYDQDGRLLSETDPLAHTTSHSYDAAGNETSVIDANGNTTSYRYDNANQLVRETGPDPDGTGPLEAPVTTYRYDDVGNRIAMVDPRGNCSGCDPAAHTTSYTYNQNNQLESEITPKGEKTTYSYDESGNLKSFVDPRGYAPGANPDDYTTSYTFDAAGRLLTTTDPLTHTTTNHYDAVGNRDWTKDANLHQTSYTFDAAGRILTVTAPDGGLTTYTYYGNGNLHTRTDDNQHQTIYGYDADNRLTQITGPDPDGPGPQGPPVTSYGYDLDGNRTSVVDANGNATQTAGDGTTGYSYDRANRLTGIDYSDTAPDVSFGYDAAGNRTSMSDGSGTVSYQHDNLDRLTSVTRGSNGFSYGYDVAGNLTSRGYPDGTQIAYNYDDDNRLASIASGGASTGYGYDSAGNLTQTTLPAANGYVETRTYDRAGRLAEVKSARGASTLSDYIATLDPVGNPTQIAQTGAVSATTGYGYDANDRLTSVCFQAGNCPGAGDPFIRWSYDKVGNRLTQTRPTGTTSYSYNPLDELTAIAASDSGTTLTYDADGQQLTQTTTPTVTASGNEITDAVRTAAVQGDGRAAPDSSFGIWEQTTNQMPNGGAESNTANWAGIGNVTTSRDTGWSKFGSASIKTVTAGSVSGQGMTAQTNTGLALTAGTAEKGSVWVKGSGSFSALLRITNSDGSVTNGTAVSVTLSTTPQRITVGATVASGKTGSKVELRLTTSKAAAVSFWADGAQIEKLSIATPYVHTDGATASRGASRVQAPASLLSPSQGWAALRLRTGITSSDLSTARTPVLFQWKDDTSHYLKLYLTSGKKWTLERNGTSSAVGINASFTAGTSYTVVAAWTTTTLKLSINGATFTTVTNTNVPNLVAALFDIASAAGSSQLDGDLLWFATGTGTLTNTDATTLKNLANTDPTLTTLPTTSTQTAVWAANTTTLQKVGGTTTKSFGWDLANRPSSATINGQSTSYGYDGDGNRLTATTNGNTTNYVWDTSNPLPQLALEQDGAGNLLRRYLYGPAQHPLAMTTPSGSFYYHDDTLGSVTNLTDSTGTTQWTYSYEPYGSNRTTTKNDPSAPANPIQFTGEYLDPTGLYNLRARQYDPSVGQFIEPDPAAADTSTPATSSYAYTADQPTVMVDPSGQTYYPANDGPCAAADATSPSEGDAGGSHHKSHWYDLLVPWSPSNPIRNSYGTSNFIRNWDPAYLAVSGYGNEWYAAAHGCSFGGSLKYGLEGAAGVGLTVLTGVGAGGVTGTVVRRVAAEEGSQAADITFGHGARHLVGTGLRQSEVEAQIQTQVERTVSKASSTGSFWGRVRVDGQTVGYRAYTLPNGTINIGTYYVVP